MFQTDEWLFIFSVSIITVKSSSVNTSSVLTVNDKLTPFSKPHLTGEHNVHKKNSSKSYSLVKKQEIVQIWRLWIVSCQTTFPLHLLDTVFTE